MGVYVFRCLHGPYVKVGHHQVTRRRPNAYYRVAGRGFESVIHPDELTGFLYVEHLQLEGWYPTLAREHETEIHRAYKHGKIGEFHPLDDMPSILQRLDSMGPRVNIGSASRRRAIRWGYKQVRRARRRAAG